MQEGKPSEAAQMMFNLAHDRIAGAKNASANEMPADLIDALNYTIQGLMSLMTGVRATYIKLEEIETLIKQQQSPPGGRKWP